MQWFALHAPEAQGAVRPRACSPPAHRRMAMMFVILLQSPGRKRKANVVPYDDWRGREHVVKTWVQVNQGKLRAMRCRCMTNVCYACAARDVPSALGTVWVFST